MNTLSKKLEWLYNLNFKGINLGLERVSKLAELTGNPQDNYKVIHIAGTNGKGSTAKILYTILREQGYSVGLYTSPHLVRFNERIIVNDKEITDQELVQLMDTLKEITEKNNIDATFFEFTTMLGFMHFAGKKIDIAIIETGLGGRLDATNITKPILSIITPISVDHTDYLGDDIEKIAFEKASIIKKGTPAVVNDTKNSDQVSDVIQKKAEKQCSRLISVKKDTKSCIEHSDLEYQKAEIITKKEKYSLTTNLIGEYQLDNIATVILACQALGDEIKISKENILVGIEKTYWPARLEILNKKPLVILDCSHNTRGFEMMKKFIITKVRSGVEKIILVMGIAQDKAKENMIPIIAGLADEIILCRAEWRGSPTEELRALTEKCNNNITEIKNVSFAVNEALKKAGKNDAVIITGSIFVAGEAKKYLDKLTLSQPPNT